MPPKPLFKSMDSTVSPRNLEENVGMGRDISSSFIGSSQPSCGAAQRENFSNSPFPQEVWGADYGQDGTLKCLASGSVNCSPKSPVWYVCMSMQKEVRWEGMVELKCFHFFDQKWTSILICLLSPEKTWTQALVPRIPFLLLAHEIASKPQLTSFINTCRGVPSLSAFRSFDSFQVQRARVEGFSSKVQRLTYETAVEDNV